MGFSYRPQRRLSFEGDLAGLVVTVRSVSLGEMLETASAVDGLDAANFSAGDVGTLRAALTPMVNSVSEWNLEEPDGTPVPVTVDGLLSQDNTLVIGLLKAWQRVFMDVAPPLPQTSSDGQRSLEVSIPMAPLTGSPAS